MPLSALTLLALTAAVVPARAHTLLPAPRAGLCIEQALKAMPAEQRAQAEQMMKARGGPMAIRAKQQQCLSAADGANITSDFSGELTLTSDNAWTGRWGGQGRLAGAEDIPGFKPAAGGQVDYRVSGGSPAGR